MIQPTKHQTQITSPIRLKALRRELLADLQRREELAEQPTQHVAAVRKLRSVNLTPLAAPMLPKDEQGRPYYTIINPFEDTVDLVEAAVKHYRACTGSYPTAICLSALRYIARFFLNGNALRCYYPKDVHAHPIHYIHEGAANYDVLVR